MNLLSIEAAASPASVALTLGDDIIERFCEDPRAQAEHLLGLIEQLLTENAVTLGELDGLAVGRGPGSFTGLRVAAALVQGLAYSAHKRVANVSSLAAVAHQVFAESVGGRKPVTPAGRSAIKKNLDADSVGDRAVDQDIEHGIEQCNDLGIDLFNNLPNETLLVCLDARKAQVYCALYEADELGRPRQVSPEAVLDPLEVVAQFKGKAKWGAGGGFVEYPELAALQVHVIENMHPSAKAIAMRAASGAVSFEDPYLATPSYVRNNVTHGS